VAREAGDFAKFRFLVGRLEIGEELTVDGFRHLEHSARGRLLRFRLACEIAPAFVTIAAGDAEVRRHQLHLLFELLNSESRQHRHVGRFHDVGNGGGLCAGDRGPEHDHATDDEQHGAHRAKYTRVES
jgi:hypothetical protein